MRWWRARNKAVLRVGACTDRGRVRSENQDAFGCFPTDASSEAAEPLFIVADGMGGHTRGREASRLAVKVVLRGFFEQPGRPVMDRFRVAFEQANEQVYRQAHQGGILTKMGTTCTALTFLSGRAYVAHVGDSRAYRIRDGQTQPLTRDHSLVEEMRRQGLLTEADLHLSAQRNVLVRGIGIEPAVRVDVSDVGDTRPDDRFVLCTDGLAHVSEEEICRVVLTNAPQRACETLVQMANDRGGLDNVTVLVICID